ncbi:keto reductase [Tothia fuscella]|uniref:Keto reductase n=1 Tax=Tothia fuscella TaxID=1048955 RepID=A0A9P4TWH4_9PEZI|nr:keto reductase [Tothia fuscella]
MSALKIVFGTMNLGRADAPLTRVHDLKECASLLDVFQEHGHSEVDTARLYGFGSTEEYLAQLNWQDRGIAVGTKLSPKKIGPNPYSHKAEDLKRGVKASLDALQTKQLDLFYLHMPDRATHFAETLEAVNDLYNAGAFKRFGICNYAAWEVAQICELCESHGWKKPDIYQASYNALHRTSEPELFPCLRHYGIAFYVFSPLAGGMLSDRYQRTGSEHEKGSRFDPNAKGYYRNQYWNEPSFAALDVIRSATKRHGMTTSEAALRWSSHHSLLKAEHGDAIIIGASKVAHLEENLVNLEKGPLPDDVVKAFDEAWGIVKATAVPYFV